MTAPDASAVRTTWTGPVQTAVLNRPELGNPLDDQLIDALHQVLDSAEREDGQCQAVVLRATGQHFCQGMPLDPDRLPTAWASDEPPPWRLFQRISTCSVPVIAVVDGATHGGGVGLTASCDLAIAGPRASWRLTEALLGLVPAMAMPFIAARTGPARVRHWVLTAQRIDAAQAHESGLADIRAADPDEALRSLLLALRRLPPGTAAALKAYHHAAFPQPAGLSDTVRQTFAERLGSSGTVQRLRTLREAGLL